MEWPQSSFVDNKNAHGASEIQWTLRTESEAYLDGLEAKLRRTQSSSLLPPPRPSTTALGLHPQPEEDFDFEEEGDEYQEEFGACVDLEEEVEGEGGAEEDELIDDALLDDPGLSLLWDSPLPSDALPAQAPPTPLPSSTASSPPIPLLFSSPSAIPSRSARRSISFSDDHLQPPLLNSYTSTLTTSTSTNSTDSLSPSTSYTRPNRFLSSPNPNSFHPHRDRTLSRSRSRSSFTTISESPSPPGSLTPTSQHATLPPVPAVRRSVRFNPRTLLRPASFGSYTSDRSGELVSSSPLRGFMAWRLGGGPKPAQNHNKSGSNASYSPRHARVQKEPAIQSWNSYYGTFSSSQEEIRGNPLLYEPTPRVKVPPVARKTEEEVMFGSSVWERAQKWEWWCWKAGWEEDVGWAGCCWGVGWEEDDWGEQQQGASKAARAVTEGRGFF